MNPLPQATFAGAAACQAPQPRSKAPPVVTFASPPGVALLLAGICIAMLQVQLADASIHMLIASLAVAIGWRWPRTRWLLIPLFGFAWASLHAGWVMQQRLPGALVGQDLRVEGHISGLPETGERRVSFDFRVERGFDAASVLAGRRLRIAWYGADPDELTPGQRWQLTVRLKRPRGVQNPGGFDYERHVLVQRISATGHVRDGHANRRLGEHASIDRVRVGLAGAIDQRVEPPAAALLRGLAVGDTRGLQSADWETLRATGLSHLLAISGLHIGLVAAFGALLARALYWLWPDVGLRLPRPQGVAWLALVFAAGYAALAGFGLPAQRSLLMIAVVLVATLARRSTRPVQGLALAALVLLVVDPLSVLGAGFWLSFVGVFWLLLCLPGNGRPVAAVRSLVHAQWAMSIGLLPLTLWFFGQVSLAGALANLIAVPWVSLVVVPLTLTATALLAVAPAWADWPLQGAAFTVELLWSLARWIAAWPWAQRFVPEAPLGALLLGFGGVLWLLLPRTLPGKPMAALLLVPMLLPAREPLQNGELDLQLVDVGQGLAVLLRTRDESVLYDAGPAFAGGLDLGEAAVLPTLRAIGVDQLDRLVLSHGDNDHAGGGPAIRRAYPDALRISGEPERVQASPCVAGDRWTSAGVAFRFLHPTANFPELGNNSSCVLRVDTAAGAVLVTGDIDEVVEARLLRQAAADVAARVLLVPHHGSASSSSAAFVQAVDAEFALIGVGHGNRFGHPRDEVLQRYRERGSDVLRTDASGAIRLLMRADGRMQIEHRRQTHRRFWHER